MGAPLKEIKREDYIRVKLTAEEKEGLIDMVKASNYKNISSLVRDVTLKGQYKVVTIDKNLINRNDLLLQQTRNIGNNFNQLLKLLNSKKINYFTKNDIEIIKLNLFDIKSSYNNIENYFKK